MSIFKKNIREDHAIRKVFDYNKNDIKLSFTLRIDIKSELNTFRDLLEKALEDIKKEIEE